MFKVFPQISQIFTDDYVVFSLCIFVKILVIFVFKIICHNYYWRAFFFPQNAQIFTDFYE
ncbi:hypothetical protein C8D70_104230 [Chryseobacterium sp. CBTAP 102]|nr:hypothetical protein C8D70_104230 [Chryseobacterium sp. CBTAP 102]